MCKSLSVVRRQGEIRCSTKPWLVFHGDFAFLLLIWQFHIFTALRLHWQDALRAGVTFLSPTRFLQTTARPARTTARWRRVWMVCSWFWWVWPRPSPWQRCFSASSAASKRAAGESLRCKDVFDSNRKFFVVVVVVNLKLYNLKSSCVRCL